MVAEILLAGAAMCGEPCQLIKLDLSAGPVVEQLMEISRRRRIEFVFSLQDVDGGFWVPALRGTYTVSGAVNAVLKTTPYSWEWSRSNRAFVVTPIRPCNVRSSFHGLYPVPPCKVIP